MAAALKGRSPTEIDDIFESWYALYIEMLGQTKVDQLIAANFQAEITKARSARLTQLENDQQSVDDSCKMDVANQALRATIAVALAPIDIVAGNLAAAKEKSGAAAQAIRATTGVSVGDIAKHGPLGGEESEARKGAEAIENGFQSIGNALGF